MIDPILNALFYIALVSLGLLFVSFCIFGTVMLIRMTFEMFTGKG